GYASRRSAESAAPAGVAENGSAATTGRSSLRSRDSQANNAGGSPRCVPVVGQCASMGPRPGGHGKTDRPPGKGRSIGGGRKPERARRYTEKVTVTPCHLRLAVDNGDRWGARPGRHR